ncbi:VOC family protein [Streptomyces sp. BI20]|uniref:VOC family protein n=1 Tax=Streptomyces sp. BI20 TaxID=3403460 RepID=UPI003C711DB6
MTADATPTMIFVNLPVKDLEATKTFWGKLGYSFNAQFSDENCASMPITDTIVAMFLTHGRFKDFTTKEIADTTRTAAALLCLSSPSREAVDATVDTALAAGATEPRPAQDYGQMYGRAFEDLDGQTWEIMWMDPAMVQG